MPDEEERKNTVLKVDEINVKNLQVSYNEDEIDKQESMDEDVVDLPKSLGEKYNLQRKGKRSKNKRAKTGETEEVQNPTLAQQTITNKITEITHQVTEKISNSELDKKEREKLKKRNKKNVLKSKYENVAQLNPEKWDQALESSQRVLNKEMSIHKKGDRGSKKKGGRNNSKTSSAKKPQNRFAFLDKQV